MTKTLAQMPADIAARVKKIDAAIKNGEREMLTAGAVAAKRAQLEVMQRDAGGDLRLSHVGKRGARIGARFDLVAGEAFVKATGPVPLLANPTKPHTIPRAGRRRPKGLLIPGVGVRASVNHPGTKGKDTWNRGRESAQPKIRAAIGEKSDAIVRRAFLSGG